MQISFGKKIPIMQCCIKDMENNKRIPATVCEYDCQTSEDAEDILYMGGNWHFHINMACDMREKYIKENFDGEKSPAHFYLMENPNGKTVAICETVEKDNEISIKYVESERDFGHKYCGKTMLAALGKKLLNNHGKRLYIPSALFDAHDFYVKGCGFEEINDSPHKLQMMPEQIDKFISATELQTGGKIL